MEYRQKSLYDLRAKFIGRTAEEIDEMISSGEISFDEELYTITKSNRTISGMYPVFTPKYRKKLAEITGLKKPGSRGLVKLDSLLQSGGNVVEVSPVEMYISESSRERGRPDRMICVYLDVPVDDVHPDGTAEVLFRENGRFVRGSYMMNSNKETYI